MSANGRRKPAQGNIILGKKIRYLRERLGMTQEDLQHALGYESSGFISQVETGICGMKRSKIDEAAKILGVHPVVLHSSQDMAPEELEMLANLWTMLQDPTNPHRETIRSLLQLAASQK